MPANVQPIYSLTPNIGRVQFTAANVKSDGTGTIGTDISLAFTAGANGAWITKIRFYAVATTAATLTAATVIRAFISTKTSGATIGGTDTFLIQEVQFGAVTADHSTTPTSAVEIPCNFALNANQTILVSTHVVAIAATFWQAQVLGGDF